MSWQMVVTFDRAGGGRAPGVHAGPLGGSSTHVVLPAGAVLAQLSVDDQVLLTVGDRVAIGVQGPIHSTAGGVTAQLAIAAPAAAAHAAALPLPGGLAGTLGARAGLAGRTGLHTAMPVHTALRAALGPGRAGGPGRLLAVRIDGASGGTAPVAVTAPARQGEARERAQAHRALLDADGIRVAGAPGLPAGTLRHRLARLGTFEHPVATAARATAVAGVAGGCGSRRIRGGTIVARADRGVVPRIRLSGREKGDPGSGHNGWPRADTRPSESPVR